LQIQTAIIGELESHKLYYKQMFSRKTV